jgi:hypothetical protein
MTQKTYRILPQSVTLYGVEITEPDKAPRVLLTCSTEATATAWILELKRLSAAKFDTGGRKFAARPPQLAASQSYFGKAAPPASIKHIC